MKLLSSSFRDPAGFLFIKDNELFRQVTEYYKKDYDLLMKSGLYNELVSERLLIPHKEINFTEPELNGCYRIIKPELIKFISYPYEWSFSQLKDTALTTLTIQKKALSYGMSLKDSSAYNIQFHNGKPSQ